MSEVDVKQVKDILNMSIEGKALITKTQWLEDNELKFFVSEDTFKELMQRYAFWCATDLPEHRQAFNQMMHDIKNAMQTKKLQKELVL